MTADLTLKRGDTYPPLSVTLTDASGAIDLTTASAVHLEMRSMTGATVIPSMGCAIPSPALGYIRHMWAATETGMVDTWNAEFEIQWAGGGIQTVPNDGVKSIAIIADLEGS